MKALSTILILALALAFGCGDEDDEKANNVASNNVMDMGSTEEDMGSTEEDMGSTEEDMAEEIPDMDFGPCEPDQYLSTVDDSCQSCPGTPLTCENILPNITVDPINNTVTFTFDNAGTELADIEWSGQRAEGDGMSEQTIPIQIPGVVDGDTVTFDLSNEEEGDELRLGRLRITDGCEESQVFTLPIRWIPGDSVIFEPTCP